MLSSSLPATSEASVIRTQITKSGTRMGTNKILAIIASIGKKLKLQAPLAFKSH